MENLIHEAQNGVVPGRVIHDTIDIFYALQKLVNEEKVPKDAIALFLDFKKLYDSLDWTFFYEKRWHGINYLRNLSIS